MRVIYIDIIMDLYRLFMRYYFFDGRLELVLLKVNNILIFILINFVVYFDIYDDIDYVNLMVRFVISKHVQIF